MAPVSVLLTLMLALQTRWSTQHDACRAELMIWWTSGLLQAASNSRIGSSGPKNLEP